MPSTVTDSPLLEILPLMPNSRSDKAAALEIRRSGDVLDPGTSYPIPSPCPTDA